MGIHQLLELLTELSAIDSDILSLMYIDKKLLSCGLLGENKDGSASKWQYEQLSGRSPTHE